MRNAPISLVDSEAKIPTGTMLGKISELPDHGGKEVIFEEDSGRLSLLIQYIKGEVYTYINVCPHARTPLNMNNEKFLDLTGSQLLCKTHGARFRITDGQCTDGPCKGESLQAVAITVAGDYIFSA